jgi:CubicO group peptidase (beta-lactamase class C family)
VLGRIIEAVSGQKYHEFIRAEIWDKLSIPRDEIGFGRSLIGQEAQNEVAYCTHAYSSH